MFSKQRGFLSLYVWSFTHRARTLNTCDLRHFQWVTWSDTWDGRCVAKDGWTIDVLLYRGKPVYEIARYREPGCKEITRRSGDETFFTAAAIAIAYRQLIRVLRHQMGIEKIENFSPTISLSKKERELLFAHPQYKSIIREFGARGWVFQLYQESPHAHTVTALKVA